MLFHLRPNPKRGKVKRSAEPAHVGAGCIRHTCFKMRDTASLRSSRQTETARSKVKETRSTGKSSARGKLAELDSTSLSTIVMLDSLRKQ
jgi:hypothetical protein